MSQQALDLRTSIKIVRRHRWIFWSVVVIGLLIGAAYTVLKPPMLTSTALVVLPQAPAAAASTGDGTGTGGYMATQVVIASSDSVLSGALPHIRPSISLQTLQSRIQVTSLTTSILSFRTNAGTAAQAEATANAVANSYISYLSASTSPLGHVPAKVLESATNATGSKLPERLALFGLLGALGGVLVGFVVALGIGRSDRRLTERDAIANSIGAPVLASLPVSRPNDAESWAKLLGEYEPGMVNAWALHKMLLQFGVANVASNNGTPHSGFSLTIISVSSDQKALALGPQLAAFASSLGITTALVIGPQQDVNATATLRTMCAAAARTTVERRKRLRLMVCDDGNPQDLDEAFVVVVTVVDGQAPRIPQSARTSATVLGVSAGAATAEELARAATAAAADGREIFGILVGDPDPGDQTTGRIPRMVPPLPRLSPPTRTSDVPSEIKR